MPPRLILLEYIGISNRLDCIISVCLIRKGDYLNNVLYIFRPRLSLFPLQVLRASKTPSRHCGRGRHWRYVRSIPPRSPSVPLRFFLSIRIEVCSFGLACYAIMISKSTYGGETEGRGLIGFWCSPIQCSWVVWGFSASWVLSFLGKSVKFVRFRE